MKPGKGALGSEDRDEGGSSDAFDGTRHVAAEPGTPAMRKGRRRKRRRGRKVYAREPRHPEPGHPEHSAPERGGRAAAVPEPASSGHPIRNDGRFSGAVEDASKSASGPAAGAWNARRTGAAPISAGSGEPLATEAQERSSGKSGASVRGTTEPSPRGDPRRLRAFPYRREPRPGDLPAYAALDLGTNNCRLLVAVPGRPGQFRVIDAFSRIVRLGEGLSTSGRLSEAAMERAVEALRICADKLGGREVRRARLIATEACRSAENGVEFLGRVKDATGLTLEIIDRETEARLAVSGCGPLVERDTDAVTLFDIGGGSSEIALVDLSRERSPRLAKHIVAWTSLPVGVVSLAEKFGGRDVTRDIFAAMVAHVGEMIERFEGRASLGALAQSPRFHLLGTSGTVTTLAGVHLGLARYDRRQVDGLWMQRDHIDGMLDRMLGWDFETRVANPCIGADRADLVLAGCAILEAIRQAWPAERLRVADRGLREGILSELMAGDGAWRRGRPRVQGAPR